MTKGNRSIILPAMLASIAVLMIIPGTNTEPAFADSETSQIKVADHLKNNPLALKIIAEMEKQKIRYKEQMQQQSQNQGKISLGTIQVNVTPKAELTLAQKEVEQARERAKERLAEKITDLSEEYKDYTSSAAFSRFLEKKPEYTHPVFQGMFDYVQNKVDTARVAMKQVIENGGTLREARDAYFSHASTTRVELIQVGEELNIQHGLADRDTQDTFDEFGKLPRYDDA